MAKTAKKQKLTFSIKLADARKKVLSVKAAADAAVKTGEARIKDIGSRDPLKKAQLQHALVRAQRAQLSLDTAFRLLQGACCNQFHNCDPDFR